MNKELHTTKKPTGEVPVCHDQPMTWDKYRAEWRCQQQLAHWAKVIVK